MDFLQFILDALLFVGIVGLLFLAFIASPDRGWRAGLRKAAVVGAALLTLLLVMLMSVVIVPAGFVGVVSELGRVQASPLTPGFHIRLPFVNSVVMVDTRVQGIRFENLGAASREYQDVIMTGTLNVHVDQTKAPELFQTVGLDYSSKIVVPFYANLVKEVVPKYTIDQVLPNREAIRKETVEKLTAKLLQYGIVVDDVAIENISFSEAYTKAIEAKQVAQQQVQTEQQILEQKKIQAQQRIVEAQGNATAAIESAKGTAEANRLLAESLTEIVVQYEYIRRLNPNVQVIYLPSDANLFINPPAKTTP